MPTRRFGLSFEIAAPAPVHANRTDVACFVGAVARRRAAAPVTLLPEVLARWFEEGNPALAALPLRTRRVDLQTPATLRLSLRASLSGSGQPEAAVARLLQRVEQAPAAPLQALLTACRTLTPLPAAQVADLLARGYRPGGSLGADPLAAWLRLQRLLDLPVALEAFETFDALFDWPARPVLSLTPRPGDPVVCTPLGAAVRAFFGEGGQRCYVVCSGDPVPLLASASARLAVVSGEDAGPSPAQPLPGHRAQLRGLRPEFSRPIELLRRIGVDGAPEVSSDPADWCGLEHVYGLADVALVALPDLADAVAHRLDEATPLPPPAGVPAEVFSDCEEPVRESARPAGRLLAPPRARDEGLQAWMALVRRALAVLDNRGRALHRRDLQLITSLPLALPARGAPQPDTWLAWMAGQPAAEDGWWSTDDEMVRGEPLARLQVGWPWLVTRESADCPGGIEAPEGTLAGVLARNALARGSFRLATATPLRRYVDAEPALHLTRALDHAVDTRVGALALAERICLLGPSPRGPRLWSDVSFASQAEWRPASVRRLVNVVVNAARRIGDELAFEANGEALWAQVRRRLGDLGRMLLAGGALSSDAGARAFVVRCGRDTMMQADIDAGRLLVEVVLVPAQPVQRIVVMLALRDAQPLAAVRVAA